MAIKLPRDDDGIAMQLLPALIAETRTVSSSISSSTTVAIDVDARIIRAYAKTQDVYLKWGSTAVTSANFDAVIPAGQIVDLVIPRDASGALYTTLRVIEQTSSAQITLIQY